MQNAVARSEPKLDATLLAVALSTLARAELSSTERNRAAVCVLGNVFELSKFLVREFSWLRRCSAGERDALLAAARQEVLVAAVRTGTRFHGNDEREANAWCRRVMYNFLLMEMRRRRSSAVCAERLAALVNRLPFGNSGLA